MTIIVWPAMMLALLASLVLEAAGRVFLWAFNKISTYAYTKWETR